MNEIDIRRLDMTLLLVFQELMRHRKLTAVAQRLGLTQSTISHSLRRLREAFDDELFLRHAGGVEPTARAQELEPVIRDILELARRALDRNEAFEPSHASGVVRIAMPDHHCALMVRPLIDLFARDAPGLQTSIRPLVRQQALDALAANEVDLAIGHFLKCQEGLSARLLLEDDHVVVARRDHPVIRRKLDLKSFARVDHLLVTLGGGLEGIVDRALARQDLKRRLVAGVPYFMPALAIVSRTDVIATIPRRHAEAFAADFALRIFEPPLELPSYRVAVAWHARNAKSGLIQWVVEALADIAGPRGQRGPDQASGRSSNRI
jgi:DNA-binding transcriptional LysR family regulator